MDPEEDPLHLWKVQSPKFPGKGNLHNHTYQFVQPSLHLNSCPALQTTLSPHKELHSSRAKLICMCFWLGAKCCDTRKLHNRQIKIQRCHEGRSDKLHCHCCVSAQILQHLAFCTSDPIIFSWLQNIWNSQHITVACKALGVHPKTEIKPGSSSRTSAFLM